MEALIRRRVSRVHVGVVRQIYMPDLVAVCMANVMGIVPAVALSPKAYNNAEVLRLLPCAYRIASHCISLGIAPTTLAYDEFVRRYTASRTLH